jgi:hypothetical protein
MSIMSLTFSSTRRTILGIALGSAALLGVAACGGDEVQEITVLHGPVPAPTVLAAGDGAPAVGDTRVFHFTGETSDGVPVLVDWIMTTTAVDTPEVDVESRINTATFSFDDHNNQIVIEGVALYPTNGAILAVAEEVRRVIVGGSGRYAGVHGEVVSVQADDGSWEHRFLIED